MVGSRCCLIAGSAELPETPRPLDEIADEDPRALQHCDGEGSRGPAMIFPTDATPPQQSMDLSLHRAQAAADYLTSQGVDPQVLSRARDVRHSNQSTSGPITPTPSPPTAGWRSNRTTLDRRTTGEPTGHSVTHGAAKIYIAR